MIYRKKYIDLFRNLIYDSDKNVFAIVWPTGIGKSTFLKECEQFDVFGERNQYQHIQLKDAGLEEKEVKDGMHFVILDTGSGFELSHIRSFIDRLSPEIKIVFTTEVEVVSEDIVSFILPPIWLREYLEHECGDIRIPDVLSGNIDIEKLNKYRDLYISSGGYPVHLYNPASIQKDFIAKKQSLYKELYTKEYSIFDSYLRTIAMNIGNLFKADQIAKLLGISRRKVNKYTEILLSHSIIEAIGPWVQNSEVETSRHVKLYFNDLSYLKGILWDMHAEGTLRQGATENMIFLELKRKLDDTHTLYFYRKKSGAEISFIAENNENTLVTPMIVTTRGTEIIPQVFRVFDSEYHDRVERYMLFNDIKSGTSSIDEKQVMILPHIAI
jgi:Domain of unknown function (DUF4143)